MSYLKPLYYIVYHAKPQQKFVFLPIFLIFGQKSVDLATDIGYTHFSQA